MTHHIYSSPLHDSRWTKDLRSLMQDGTPRILKNERTSEIKGCLIPSWMV